jgi:hypothetical protein
MEMIDIEKEHLIPLKDGGKRIPGRAGKPVSRATLWRWALTGRQGVRLETVLLGGRFTSIEAIARFVAKLNDAPNAVQLADRGDKAEMADKLLAAEGF